MLTKHIKEVRVERRNEQVIGRCFGTTVVGPRGQVVIPVEARKEIDVDAGSKLLVFGHFNGQGLIFVKVEVAEELLNIMSSKLDEVARVVRQSKVSGAGMDDEGSPSE